MDLVEIDDVALRQLGVGRAVIAAKAPIRSARGLAHHDQRQHGLARRRNARALDRILPDGRCHQLIGDQLELGKTHSTHDGRRRDHRRGNVAPFTKHRGEGAAVHHQRAKEHGQGKGDRQRIV